MAIMDGGIGLFVMSCSPGNAILSMPQFHISIVWLGLYTRYFEG